MPASSSEARARWRKRKREQRRKSKLKELENDDTFDDNEDEDDPDLDPPQNHLQTEDDPHNNSRNQILLAKESEKLADGGLKINEFPIAVKRVVNRAHSSVFGIVEAERAARNGENGGQGQIGVAVLENISYGQLQTLSVVPRDSAALLEETESGSLVIVPPTIIAGSGVLKRLGSAARVHVLPVHSEWFSPNSVHRLERQVVPHFFSGKSTDHTPEKYMENRNLIVAKYMENPEKHLSVADCQGLASNIDIDDLTRIVRFLDHWGIINYCADPLKHEPDKDGTYLCEDSNGELHVPSAALKSIDSLIQFDKPKCKLKAFDAYPELACRCAVDSDIDINIREQLSDQQCHFCSRRIATVYYQSQKEADILLCLDCFNEGIFVAGHSSIDFLKVDSMNNYGDVDGDNWTDQETLLLLEGMQLHNENWNKIAEHVGSKSKAQCIVHFVRLPLDGAPLENIDVPSTSVSSNFWDHDDHERSESKSNGFNEEKGDFESKFPFANSENSVMNLVAFLASALGPRVAAACAHASLASLCNNDGKEGSPHGEITNSCNEGSGSQNDDEAISLSSEKVKAAAKDGLAAAAAKAKLFTDHEEREIQRLSAEKVKAAAKDGLAAAAVKAKLFADHEEREIQRLSAEKVKAAAKDGLAAAAVKAKLFADHEEREIQRLSANIVNHQLKRLELKLKQFAEIETLLMRECEQMERTRQRIASERALMASGQFIPTGASRPMGPPSLGPLTPGNSRPQAPGPQNPPSISGYGNRKPIHPNMLLMHQQGMYGPSPRFPLSAIQPSPSTSNSNFNPTSNSQSSLGHSMLRPVTGTKSGLG